MSDEQYEGLCRKIGWSFVLVVIAIGAASALNTWLLVSRMDRIEHAMNQQKLDQLLEGHPIQVTFRKHDE